MLSIDINHPDVEQFATIKEDLTKVTGANISIRLNKEFIKAVEKDEDYVLRFPCNKPVDYILDTDEIPNLNYNELTPILCEDKDVYVKKIKAKELWNTIVEQARNNAEPGLLFWDNILEYSPDGVYENFRAISTNPCGEIPMGAYDSCRLMCLNLFSFVDNPFTDKAKINYKKLYEIAYEQQRLMDDLVDLELEAIEKIINKIKSDNEPENIKQTELHLWEKIYATGKAGRRTGSGITALADMLAALGIKYDSDEALEITDKVMKTKMEAELDCTIDLSILRGSFEGYNSDLEFGKTRKDDFGNEFYRFLYYKFPNQVDRMGQFGRRNVSWSTIAPTGSVSILTQTTSGCEPIFQPFYMRRKKINPNEEGVRVDFTDDNGDKWQEYPVLHEKFKDWINLQIKSGGTISAAKSVDDIKQIPIDINNKKHLDLMFRNSPWYKSTANDIKWEYRLKMQEVLQKYTSHSISSTLNLPENTSVDTVSQIYMKASQMGLKGVTIYRNNSRSGVLVDESKNKSVFEQHDAPKRPKILPCQVHKTTSKGKPWLVIVGLMDNKPYEVFCVENVYNFTGNHLEGELVKERSGVYQLNIEDNLTINKLTSEMSDEEAALTRLLSTSLRHGTSIQFLVEQLSKSSGSIVSFTNAIGRILKRYIPEGAKSTLKCEDCGDQVVFEEGCSKCKSCGSSRCG